MAFWSRDQGSSQNWHDRQKESDTWHIIWKYNNLFICLLGNCVENNLQKTLFAGFIIKFIMWFYYCNYRYFWDDPQTRVCKTTLKMAEISLSKLRINSPFK